MHESYYSKQILNEEALKVADVNEDGSVNIFDLTRIMNYIIKKSDTL